MKWFNGDLMLVMKSNTGERVTITVPPSAEPTEIVITLTEVCTQNRVRIGYDAPKEVSIHRDDARVKRFAPAKTT